jgi:hypothetical protein
LSEVLKSCMDLIMGFVNWGADTAIRFMQLVLAFIAPGAKCADFAEEVSCKADKQCQWKTVKEEASCKGLSKGLSESH